VKHVDPVSEPADRGATRALEDAEDFVQWRDRLPSFDADGERLYLPSGDVPMDEQQLAEHWNRAMQERHGRSSSA